MTKSNFSSSLDTLVNPLQWLPMKPTFQKIGILQSAAFAIASLFFAPQIARGDCVDFLLDSIPAVGGQAGAPIDLMDFPGLNEGSDFRLILPANWTHEIITQAVSNGVSKSTGFRIQAPVDCEPGCYPVRLAIPGGVSNSRNLWITREPWLLAPNNNIASDVALRIESGKVYHGTLEPRKEFFFSVELPAESAWELNAKTLGIDSRASLLWEIRSPQNQVVALSNRGVEREPIFQFENTVAGSYTIKLSDQLFRGGPDYQYAFQIAPVSSSQERRTSESDTESKSIQWFKELTEVDPRKSSDPSILFAPEADINAKVQVHEESRYSNDTAMPISVPSITAAQFDNNRDFDSFEIELNAGQSIAIDVLSSLIGQSTDPKLTIYKLENLQSLDKDPAKNPAKNSARSRTKVIDLDDPPSLGSSELRLASKDPTVVFKCKEQATYQIVLSDQQRSPKDVYKVDRGRSQTKAYFLQVRIPDPDFRLLAYFASPSLKPEKSQPVAPTLLKNQVACVEVIAVRKDGFSLPIRVEAINLPASLSCRPVTIPENQTRAALMIYSLGNDSNILLDPLEITGESEVINRLESSISNPESMDNGVAGVRHPAYAAEINHGPIPTRPVPTRKLIPNLLLATNKDASVPLSIRIGEMKPTIEETLYGSSSINIVCPQDPLVQTQKIRVPIQLIREPGFHEAVNIHGFRMPNGVSLSELTIAGDRSFGELEMSIQGVSQVLPFPLIVIGETKSNQAFPAVSAFRKKDTSDPAVRLWSLPANVECKTP